MGRLLLLIWTALAVWPTCAAARPERIVSINLCTDNYLVLLADKDQIAALTIFADDESLSPFADRAAPFRKIRGTAEEVIALEPDLVLAGRFTAPATRSALRRLNVSLFELPSAETLSDIRRQIKQVAAAIGQDGRGEALLAEYDGRSEQAWSASQGPFTAISYQRGGLALGSGGLLSDILARAGIANVLGPGRKSSFHSLSLEEVLQRRSDILVVEERFLDLADEGSRALSHPALQKAYPPQKRVMLKQSAFVCGGPAALDAVSELSQQLQRLPHRAN